MINPLMVSLHGVWLVVSLECYYTFLMGWRVGYLPSFFILVGISGLGLFGGCFCCLAVFCGFGCVAFATE
jgi:hypothetical protein